MTDKQPEALRLADYMHDHFDLFVTSDEFKTAKELRRLYESQQEMLALLKEVAPLLDYWVSKELSDGAVGLTPEIELRNRTTKAIGSAT